MPSSDPAAETPEAGAGRPQAALAPGMAELVAGIRAGRRAALARAISVVENEREGFQALLHALLEEGGAGEGASATARVGVTGPPGAGKSSLVSALARTCRAGGESVGIVAVDPTSPYSGGALLGDRIRMNELATDPGMFIRSMASRGSLGGLATTTKEVIDVMEAFAFPWIFVETVGVGQAELEITGAADTVVVVLVPESGDAIQAMKAGLMEIADVFVVNKADRPGADRLARDIRAALRLRGGAGGRAPSAGHHGPAAGSDEAGRGSGRAPEAWAPPVLLTRAHLGEGISELHEAVGRHREHLERSGELARRRRRRMLDRIRDVLDRELRRRVRRELARDELVSEALERISSARATPYSEAARILGLLARDPSAAPLPPPRGGASDPDQRT